MLFRIISCPSCGYESNGQGGSCNKCGTPLAQHDLVTKIQPKLQPLSPHHLGSGDPSKQLLEHAKKLLAEGKVRESEIIFKQVIASGQYTAEGFYGAGLVRLRLNDMDGAADHFRNALRQDPQSANALYQLGMIAERQKSWQEAYSFYEKTLEIHPQHTSARDALERLTNFYKSVPQNGFNRPNAIDNIAPPAIRRNVSPTAGGTLPLIDGSDLSKYGVYGALLQDPSPTSRSIIALIDDLRMNRIHPTFTAFLGSFLVRLFLALFFGIGASYASSSFAIAASILCLISIIMKIVSINCTTFTLDKGRLQAKKGVFGQKTWNEELWRVHDIEFRRTLLNRLTGDGTLIFKFEHKREPLKVSGLAKGAHLDEIYQQLLNLVGLLRSMQALKGILQ